MGLFNKLFGKTSSSSPRAAAPSKRDSLSERDNVGTRYETEEKVNSFWTPYILSRPKFPFIFYDMPEKKDAMEAILSLQPIKIAADSGKLISTDVLQFGVYPHVVNGKTVSWGFFLAGDRITPALYAAAIASCKRCNGTDPRVSDPPKSTAAAAPGALSKSMLASVTFDWEEKVDMLKQMKACGIEIAGAGALPAQVATKRHHKAPNKESALAFLKANSVDRPYYYLIVHTPEGVFGRDKDGIFEQ